MKFGAHVSSASPFSESLNRAKSIGAECMQVFVNAPQRWNPIVIPESEIERFVQLNSEVQIGPIISHTIYLISLSGNNSYYYSASEESIIDEMKKGERMGFFGVNTHLGSSKDKSFDEVAQKVIDGIKHIIDAVPNGPYFIIENSAGAGNIIGDTLEEIGTIVRGVGSPRVKVLIDTAHAFESGYALHEKQGLEDFIGKFDQEIGIDRLVGLHINDSATPFNSKRDRHADIGTGEIGVDAIGRIINHPKLKNLFGIIETPSLKGKGDIDNLEILRSLQA